MLNEHTHDEKPIKEAIYQTIEAIKAKTLEGSATPAELVEQELGKLDPTIQGKVSLLGVESLWGVCTFIPVDWGS